MRWTINKGQSILIGTSHQAVFSLKWKNQKSHSLLNIRNFWFQYTFKIAKHVWKSGGYLVKPAWLWYFPEVRNSKGTESGLAAIPDLWLSLSIAIRLYVCIILHILAEPRDCTIVKEKNRDGQLQKVGIVHLRYWNWGLECLVSFYTALIPFSYLSQASSPIQFPQPTCSCTTHFLSEAENLSNACSMTYTCWRRETC